MAASDRLRLHANTWSSEELAASTLEGAPWRRCVMKAAWLTLGVFTFAYFTLFYFVYTQDILLLLK